MILHTQDLVASDEPCGAVDPTTGAVCTVTLHHEVHKDESPDFVITWVDRRVLITP